MAIDIDFRYRSVIITHAAVLQRPPRSAEKMCMRRVLNFCLAIIIAAASSAKAAPQPANSKKNEPIQINASHIILIDAGTNNVLFEKSADQAIAPGGFASLMTAEVVFDALAQGRIKLDDQFEVSENAWRRGGAPSHTSSMFAPIHSKVRVEDLLRGAIVESGNDACIALAEGLAGTEANFAEVMNTRARQIGLMKSAFANSTGRPEGPGSRTTVRELAKLAQRIVETYPEFYKLYGEREFTWNNIRQQNRNPLLHLDIGADGLKASYSGELGYSLVGSATQNGVRLILVIDGAASEKERTDGAKKLFEWGFHDFDSKLLFGQGEMVGEARTYGGCKAYVPLISAHEIKLMVPRGIRERIVARIVYTGPVPAPVHQGQPIGVLKVWRDDNLALEVPLQAAEDIGGGTVVQRALDAVSELVIDLFNVATQRL